MGHPVFRVTQNFEPSAKTLKLTVEQLQTIDNTSQFPQVAFFQTPVDVEIVTLSGTRLERVQILPQKQQSFAFPVDSSPLLVNFDYRGTIIKELEFDKTTDELVYQMTQDDDVLGRTWALGQLAARVNSEKVADSDKHRMASALSNALMHDKFWGVRFDAATALATVKDPSARNALLAATKDSNARVRARAITSLASSKDPSLASLYQQFLTDQSYGVIQAAASAIGETKGAGAYESLTRLLDTPSWRDNIKASALSGLGELQDKRALDIAFRYAEKGNLPQVRKSALLLLGRIGGNNPKAFSLISETATQAFGSGDFALGIASAEALVSLGDPRGLAVLDQISHATSGTPQLQEVVSQFQERLRKLTAGAAVPSTQ
jgi:aminopeptidase N